MYFYIKYTDVTYNDYAPLSGWDIKSDCKVKPEVSTMINLSEDSLDVSVTTAILNYKKIKNECTFIKFIIPGEIGYLGYLLPQENIQKIDKNFLPIKPKYETIPYFKRNPFGYDTVTIKIKEYPKFWGILNYKWKNRLAKTSYGSRHVKIPFFTHAIEINDNDNNLTTMEKTNIKFNIPSNSLIHNLSHQPIVRQSFGTISLYSFSIDKNNSILEFNLDFPELLKNQNLIINFSLLFLGAGLALLLEKLIMFFKYSNKKQSTYKRKKKKRR